MTHANSSNPAGFETNPRPWQRYSRELSPAERQLLEAYERAKIALLNSEPSMDATSIADQLAPHFADRLDERRGQLGHAHGSQPLSPETVTAQERPYEQPCKKLFSEIPRLEGERIVLDRIVDADADALDDLASTEEVYRFEPTFLFERQFASAQETISQIYGTLFTGKDSLILAIRPKETGELEGLAEFYGLRDSLHKVSMGYRLRKRSWGKGLATEAAGLMVDYLYGQTDIQIITASTMMENVGSARVLEKNGFVRTVRGATEDWGHPQPTLVDKWFR